VNWDTKKINRRRHTQRLTEIAQFELRNVSKPVLYIQRGKEKPTRLRIPISKDGVAEAYFVSGELPNTPKLRARNGKVRINEFADFHDCFSDETKKKLKKADVVPIGNEPDGLTDLRSAFPFCPIGRTSLV
jgi:hypothetical protein